MQLQGHLLVSARGVPQELDQQQGETLTQRHRHLLQFQQVRMRDLQDPPSQVGRAERWDGGGDDHLR